MRDNQTLGNKDYGSTPKPTADYRSAVREEGLGIFVSVSLPKDATTLSRSRVIRARAQIKGSLNG